LHDVRASSRSVCCCTPLTHCMPLYSFPPGVVSTLHSQLRAKLALLAQVPMLAPQPRPQQPQSPLRSRHCRCVLELPANCLALCLSFLHPNTDLAAACASSQYMHLVNEWAEAWGHASAGDWRENAKVLAGHYAGADKTETEAEG
jgi:hypothetical protein